MIISDESSSKPQPEQEPQPKPKSKPQPKPKSKRKLLIGTAIGVAVIVASIIFAAIGTCNRSASNNPDGEINGHGYVDLGLPSGLKWATCNIGASSPEGYGNYYAWGRNKYKDRLFR